MATRDQDVPQASGSGAATGVLVREGSYGTRSSRSSRAARSSSR
jgi:hypothetical protein